MFYGTIYLVGISIINLCLDQTKREPLQPEKSMKRKRVLRMRKGLKYFLWVKMLTRPANTPNSFSSPRKCSYKHVQYTLVESQVLLQTQTVLIVRIFRFPLRFYYKPKTLPESGSSHSRSCRSCP